MENAVVLGGYDTRANQSIVSDPIDCYFLYSGSLFSFLFSFSSSPFLFHMHALHLRFVSLRREILAAMRVVRVSIIGSDDGWPRWLGGDFGDSLRQPQPRDHDLSVVLRGPAKPYSTLCDCEENTSKWQKSLWSR